DEIPQLIEFFMAKYAKRYNRREPALSPALLEALMNYSWPGNVRELENVVKRYVILQDESLLLRELQTSVRRAHAVPAGVAAAAPAAHAAAAVAAAPASAPDVADDDAPEDAVT